jgi:hypothetical protein
MHINPFNAELHPICHLLALLGAHLIFHLSRIRVNTTSYSSYFHVQALSLRQSLMTCPYYKLNNDSFDTEFVIYRFVLIIWSVNMGYVQRFFLALALRPTAGHGLLILEIF